MGQKWNSNRIKNFTKSVHHHKPISVRALVWDRLEDLIQIWNGELDLIVPHLALDRCEAWWTCGFDALSSLKTLFTLALALLGAGAGGRSLWVAVTSYEAGKRTQWNTCFRKYDSLHCRSWMDFFLRVSICLPYLDMHHQLCCGRIPLDTFHTESQWCCLCI